MAATTFPLTTKQRMSWPFASLMNSCTKMLVLTDLKALMTLSAALSVSARTTPLPCVDSSSLMISGAPLTMRMRSLVSIGDLANR